MCPQDEKTIIQVDCILYKAIIINTNTSNECNRGMFYILISYSGIEAKLVIESVINRKKLLVK